MLWVSGVMEPEPTLIEFLLVSPSARKGFLFFFSTLLFYSSFLVFFLLFLFLFTFPPFLITFIPFHFSILSSFNRPLLFSISLIYLSRKIRQVSCLSFSLSLSQTHPYDLLTTSSLQLTTTAHHSNFLGFNPG